MNLSKLSVSPRSGGSFLWIQQVSFTLLMKKKPPPPHLWWPSDQWLTWGSSHDGWTPSLPLLPHSLSSFWRLWKLTCRYTCRPAWQWRAAMPEKTQKKTSERVSVAPVDWWPRRRARGPRWSPDETDGEDLICPTEHSDSTPPPFILYIRGIKEVLGYSSERITTVALYKRGMTKFPSIKWS